MAQGGSRVMQQRRLRGELRRLRDDAGHTQKTVAESLGWSISKVIRIETGAVHVSTSDVMAMLHFYGVTDQDKTTNLLAITRAKEEAWWDSYRSVYKQQFLDFLDYENSAAHIKQYISFVLPGLLQTEDYMRALFEGYMYDEARIERAIRVRAMRQRVLAPARGMQASFMIDEAALQRWIGGADVTRRQLDHLREMAGQPNVSIRVVPFSVGMHPGVRGSFTILEYESDDQDTIVNIESPHNDVLIRDDLETTSEFVESFYALEEIATPADELDKALDDVIDRMRLNT
jgi:transcriptional regulator with XRE-family HTH domain